MKNKNKIRNIFLSIILVINFFVIAIILYFLSPSSFKSNEKSFVITYGESLSEIATNLKNENLIKSRKFFLVYLKLKNENNLYAAKYNLNTNMSLSKLVNELKKGGHNPDEITVTFKEGLNIRQIAKVIESSTNNSYDDVIRTASDEKYLDELINKYWFITDDIKNKNLYYNLEGYLFPDSYNFTSKDVTVKEIFNSMIEEMNLKLKRYEKDIEKNKLSIHQIFTMASIIELEGLDKSSRKDISGVFYNRIAKGMALGSDVTSYYGVKKEMISDITQSELDNVNPYNTRSNSLIGKLPVGPICNASIESIEAALYPNKHDYLYFVADKNGKIYMTKNYESHEKVIADLKNKGLWFEW